MGARLFIVRAALVLLVIRINPEVPWGIFSVFEAQITERAAQEYRLTAVESKSGPAKLTLVLRGTEDGKTYFQQTLKGNSRDTWALTPEDPKIAEAVKTLGLALDVSGDYRKRKSLQLEVAAKPVAVLAPNPLKLGWTRSRHGSYVADGATRVTVTFGRATIQLVPSGSATSGGKPSPR